MGNKEREAELKSLADNLTEAITGLGEKKGYKIGNPAAESKTIIEYQGRMRIAAMEKFNSSSFISYVNYYANEQDQQKNKAMGALIVYVPEAELYTLLMRLGYPKIDDESHDELMEGCGKLCTDISEAFKGKISALGYVAPVSAPVANFRNSIPLGVSFNFKEYDKYEVTFALEAKKILVAEITLAPLRRR